MKAIDKPATLPVQRDDATRSCVPLLGLSLLAFFAFFDFCLVPATTFVRPDDWAAVWVYAVIGIVLAQFAVLPVWLAWGNSAHWRRLLTIGIAVLILYAAWVLGGGFDSLIRGGRANITTDRAWIAALFLLPTFGLAVNIPLVLLRVFGGWRIRTQADGEASERPLAIADLMAATGLVALALGGARMANYLDGPSREAEFWSALVLSAGVAMVASLVAIPPLAFCALRVRSVGRGVVLVSGLAIVAALVVPLVLHFTFRRLADAWELLGIGIVILTCTCSIGCAFWLARAAGYRLEIGRAVVGVR